MKRITFSFFDKEAINNNIKEARSAEANRIIKATNVPPEIDRTLHEIFSKYGEIERIGLVKKDQYNPSICVQKSQ